MSKSKIKSFIQVCERKVIAVQEIFDISRFDEYREDNRREVKKANGGLV